MLDLIVISTLNGVLFGIFSSQGQSCIAGSRLFVERPIYEEFIGRVADFGRQLRVGNGVDPATHSLALQTALQHDMTLAGALALVVFYAFAMQCMSTLAVVKRETNSWKYPVLQFVYMTGVAYVAALATYQIGSRLL